MGYVYEATAPVGLGALGEQPRHFAFEGDLHAATGGVVPEAPLPGRLDDLARHGAPPCLGRDAGDHAGFVEREIQGRSEVTVDQRGARGAIVEALPAHSLAWQQGRGVPRGLREKPQQLTSRELGAVAAPRNFERQIHANREPSDAGVGSWAERQLEP